MASAEGGAVGEGGPAERELGGGREEAGANGEGCSRSPALKLAECPRRQRMTGF